jgi:hypothetical protein
MQCSCGIRVNQPDILIHRPNATTFKFNDPIIIVVSDTVYPNASHLLLIGNWRLFVAVAVQVSVRRAVLQANSVCVQHLPGRSIACLGVLSLDQPSSLVE